MYHLTHHINHIGHWATVMGHDRTQLMVECQKSVQQDGVKSPRLVTSGD